MKFVIVQANANIALIKYWGKRNKTLFLPTKSSLSVTLKELNTTTNIVITNNSRENIILNKKPATTKTKNQIVQFLDRFRSLYKIKDHFTISTQNSFPTSAGLASSSSGFAALTKGLNKLYNLNLSEKELSILARQGSGSACRSVYNGFVLWHKGTLNNCSDSYAEQLFDNNHWPEFRILIIVVQDKEKTISSRTGMQQTALTSPIYKQWIKKSEQRIPIIINAIKNRDLITVGKLAQLDCIEMHNCMRHATPPINYLLPTTTIIINKIKQLQKSGLNCFFTIDAGPNIKVICNNKNIDKIKEKLILLPEVKQTITCSI